MLLNAAIATRYPGHDRLAGIWEFHHREWANIARAQTRLHQRHGPRFVRDAVNESHIRRYSLHLDRSRSRSDATFSHLNPLKLDARLGDRTSAVAGVDAARAGETGLGSMDLTA